MKLQYPHSSSNNNIYSLIQHPTRLVQYIYLKYEQPLVLPYLHVLTPLYALSPLRPNSNTT